MNKIITELQKIESIKEPVWVEFVKTGAHKQRVPESPVWWFERTAGVLRKVERYGPIGTNKIAKLYGGRKDRGHKPEKKYSGSRNIIRKVLQQLESAKLIKQVSEPKSGKILTKEGKDFLKKMEA